MPMICLIISVTTLKQQNMKRSRIFLIAVLFIAFVSQAQITKANWMMGGNGGFTYAKTTSPGYTDSGGTTLYLNPNMGYFFIDKLAVGASVPLIFSKGFNSYGFAPFVRYYFLEKEKPINIFSEVSYGLRRSSQNFQSDDFNIKAGTVFFLNTSVGFEVAIIYAKQFNNSNFKTTGVSLGVGFQIHLEREK
jgi:hypothetical protein